MSRTCDKEGLGVDLAYERPLAINIQVQWGIWDEDGNLIGERMDPVERLYWPWSHNLEELLRRREREKTERQRHPLER